MGILDHFTTEEELKAVEGIYACALFKNLLTDQDTFDYAICLVQRNNAMDVNKGLRFLKELHTKNPNVIDYTYYSALGYTHLGDYEMAMCYIEEILAKDSFHKQSRDLRMEILNKVTVAKKAQQTQELKQTAMMAGGFLAAVGGIAALAYGLSSSKKKRDDEPN